MHAGCLTEVASLDPVAEAVGSKEELAVAGNNR